jgi:hypothetical protein
MQPASAGVREQATLSSVKLVFLFHRSGELIVDVDQRPKENPIEK